MKKTRSLQSKMVSYIIPMILLIFVLIIGYVTNKSRVVLLEDTRKRTDAVAEKFANNISMQLNNDANLTKGVAESLVSMEFTDDSIRYDVLESIIKNVMSNHPDFVSFWVNFELNFTDDTYNKSHGRVSTTCVRFPNGSISFSTDTMEINSVNENSFYNKLKKNKQEALVNPSYFSFTGNPKDKVLKTTYCVPLIKDNNFVGLAGVDLDLNRYNKIIAEIEQTSEGYAFLVSNNGIIFTHPKKELAGLKIEEAYFELEKKFSIKEKINNGHSSSFTFKHPVTKDQSFYSFVPIKVGESNSKWSIGYVVPFETINLKAQQLVINASIFGLFGLIILFISVYIISNRIVTPLKKTTSIINKLSMGDVENISISIKHSSSEIHEMTTSLKKMVGGLIQTSEFAKNIGKGKLYSDFEMLSDKDTLGKSLLEMRENLKVSKTKEEIRNVEIKQQNWFSKGEASFGEILRKNSENILKLSEEIVRYLVDYLDANQGAIFIKDKTEDEKEEYVMKAAVAYGRSKQFESKFLLGESLVGRCAFEKLSIYLEDVPDNYVKITSGLGESNPKCILLVPAVINYEVQAVIEIVSFKTFEENQIKFIEKMGESIASTLVNVKTAEQTNLLLEQTKIQTEELAAQEEEMRQNIEELQATQEEMNRVKFDKTSTKQI